MVKADKRSKFSSANNVPQILCEGDIVNELMIVVEGEVLSTRPARNLALLQEARLRTRQDPLAASTHQTAEVLRTEGSLHQLRFETHSTGPASPDGTTHVNPDREEAAGAATSSAPPPPPQLVVAHAPYDNSAHGAS
ncbi:hypothetical protein HaLaN_30868, partial [Haematococcus lacustris]